MLSNYKTFPRDFFSGSDVYIFFNNKLIDQIVGLQVSIQENIVPIYGYASYTYDAVARGSRIVTGSFRVNYIESMYLYTMMELINNEKFTPEEFKASASKTLTSEQISHAIKNGQFSKVRDMINQNEKRIWGEEGTTKINNFRKPYFASNVSNDIRKNGFDIVISFGDKNFIPETFNNRDDYPSTIETINGVQLTGVSKVIQPSGEAIYEEYTFIARDMNNTIGERK